LSETVQKENSSVILHNLLLSETVQKENSSVILQNLLLTETVQIFTNLKYFLYRGTKKKISC